MDLYFFGQRDICPSNNCDFLSSYLALLILIEKKIFLFVLYIPLGLPRRLREATMQYKLSTVENILLIPFHLLGAYIYITQRALARIANND